MKKAFCLLLTLLLLLTACGAKTPAYGTAVSNPYPMLMANGLMTVAIAESLKEVAQEWSTDIFVATVVKNHGAVSSPMQIEEGTALYELIKKNPDLKQSMYAQTFKIEMQISEVLLGKAETDSTVLLIANSGFSIPAMKESDQFIVFSRQAGNQPVYIPVSYDQGFFYVTDDDTVFPADKSKFFAEYNNMPLEMFLEEVRKILVEKE